MGQLGPSLERGQVHVWRVPLLISEAAVTFLGENLDSGERARCEQFRFGRDRRMYISARGALRLIVASYLNECPRALRFDYGANGKPLLAASLLSFNLSHCRDFAVIGVTPCRRIGVDAETRREIPEFEYIAERHFSKEECESIGLVTGETKNERFLQIWTRREAAIKARGEALSVALTNLEIPFYPFGSGARFGQDGGNEWFLRDLQLGPTCTGAVCVEGAVCDVVFRDFATLLSGVDR